MQVLRCLLERLGTVAVEGMVLDFEQAAWQAVHEFFPGIEIKGCAFNWAQAVWRHVQDVGLAETYRKWIGKNIRTIKNLIYTQSFTVAYKGCYKL